MSLARVLPVFTVAFAALYVVVVNFNFALVTYQPALGEWAWFVVKPKAGPPMYWYGMVLTSAIGAMIIAAVAAFVPAQSASRLWSGWAWLVPLAALVIVAFILRAYFLQ